MSFIEPIPGLDIPVEGGARRVEKVGRRRTRSARGRAQDGGRGRRPAFSFKTILTDYDEANTISNILRGRGDVIYFRDGVQGSAGTMPKEMGDGGAFDLSLAGPFTGYLGGGFAGDDPSAYLLYDYQLGNDWDLNTNWTVMWFEYNLGDSTWHRSALRSDGKFVFDGTQDDERWELGNGSGMEWEFSVFDGQLRMQAVGGDGGVLHHVVVLPCIASDTVINAFMNMTVPWGPLPMLYVTGDAVTTDHEFMFGSNVRESWVRADFGDGLGLLSNNLTIDFDISFVPSGWYQDMTVPSQGTTKCAPEVVVPDLLGGFLMSGYLETPEITVGNLSDKGAGAPASPITISGMPGTEWGYIVNYQPDGDVGWLRTLEGVNGIAAQYNRCFTSKMVSRAGDSAAYFTWWTQAEDVEVRDEAGVLVTTYNRPPNSGPGVLRWWWGGVTSIDIASGVINWTTIADWDSPAASTGEIDLRPMTLAFGGSGGDELVVGYNMSTQTPSSPVPVPVFGQAVHPAIDFARVGNSRVAGPWLVKINTATGDAVSTTSQVANFNDDIASAGTPNRGFAAIDRFNIFNIVWNDSANLWYMSANHSGSAIFNVDGVIIGRTKAGEIPTRGIDDTGGNGSVKAYIATFDADLEPQNVVTLAPDVITSGNGRYAYNQSVFIVPDGSGDVFWGWQNLNTGPAMNLQREGLLGNYGGGAYSVSNTQDNDSICVRLNTDLEVVWEASSFDSAFASLGRGHSVQMVPVPNDSTKMLAMISTQGVNAQSNDPTSLFGSPNVTFDLRQSFFAAFDISTGTFVDERELERAASGDKMVAIGVETAASGPLGGVTLSTVLMSNDTNTTVQGFNDTAGVRQYNTADYWNSNGAVYTQSNSGAIHLAAYDADGELDPSNCYPLIALQSGSVALNQWSLWTVPY